MENGQKKRIMLFYKLEYRDTKLLSHLLSSIDNPPKVLVSASTVGYYGRDKVLKEDEQLEFSIQNERTIFRFRFVSNVCLEFIEIRNSIGLF